MEIIFPRGVSFYNSRIINPVKSTDSGSDKIFVTTHFSNRRTRELLKASAHPSLRVASRRPKLSSVVHSRVIARGKKCVINLGPVWANSNQSVQILESVSRTRANPGLPLSQPITAPLLSPRTRRSHARITKILLPSILSRSA